MSNPLSFDHIVSSMFVKCVIVLILSLSFTPWSYSQVPDVWLDFVQAQADGTQSILPDYSYSGYHFSEKELPDVSSYTYFDVTDYGAVADDGGYDDESIQATIDAAVALGSPSVVFFLQVSI